MEHIGPDHGKEQVYNGVENAISITHAPHTGAWGTSLQDGMQGNISSDGNNAFC